MKLDQIKKHWEEAGKELSFSSKVTPTSRDPYLGNAERNFILRHLSKNQNVLEIGCGDAYHTVQYCKKVKHITGLDVADTLIQLAKLRAKKARINNADFITGSILDIDDLVKDKKIDCIISQRCLINLPDWNTQKEAILKLYNILPKGGYFLMTEGFQDELNNLNAARKNVGLSKINVVSYNRNFLHSEFDSFVKKHFIIEKIHNYGLYFFLSRLYHPLNVYPDLPRHDSKLNETAGILSDLYSNKKVFEEYSYNLLYILKKK